MRWRLAPVLLVCALAHPARAEDPLYIGSTELLPALPSPGIEGVEACDGTTRCVDKVIRDMTHRWRALDAECSHDAVFSLTYLLTTVAYREAVSDPQFFNDNAFVNNEDRHFANYYFEAYDRWTSGARSSVPAAWRIAFEAAEAGSVHGMGNILLGMNAHISRDLPFVLYQIGVRAPDGTSRKPDHDRVNVILNGVADTIINETAARYDESIAQGDVPGTTLDATALNQVIQAMREQAWRNAELLASTPPLLRIVVARQIETAAAAEALAIATTYGYLPGESADARDAQCAAYVE